MKVIGNKDKGYTTTSSFPYKKEDKKVKSEQIEQLDKTKNK